MPLLVKTSYRIKIMPEKRLAELRDKAEELMRIIGNRRSDEKDERRNSFSFAFLLFPFALT